MADQRDIIEVLTHDHREVEQMFGEYEALPATGSDDQRKDLVDQMIIELVRHSVAEEQYLYPTVREKVAGGGPLADRELQEHAEAEKTMNSLDKLGPGDAEFDQTVGKLMTEIKSHVAEEEGELFPQLRQACTPQELIDLGSKVEAAKKVAPTRPHPAAPDTPPFNKVAGPGAALVDRVRDFVTGRGQS